MFGGLRYDRRSLIQKRIHDVSLRTKRSIREAGPGSGVTKRNRLGLRRQFSTTPLIAPAPAAPVVVPRPPRRRRELKLASIIGQQKAVLNLRTFMKQFEDKDNIPEWPLALLSGKCGIGKTSSCYAICEDLGYKIVEVNASDTRSYRAIYDYLTKTGFGTTFVGKTALLFDEIDGAFRSDNNSIKAIVDFLTRYKSVKNKAPILCTYNAAHGSILAPLDPFAWKIKFYKLSVSNMELICRRAAREMNINISPLKRLEIVNLADGDARQIHLMLQLHGNHPDGQLDAKDHNINIWDVCKDIFKGKEDPLLVDRFRSGVRYGTGLVQANYAQVIGQDFGAMCDMAENMATFDLLQEKEFDVKEGYGSTFLVQSIRTLPNETIDLNKPAGRYFQPMSQKIVRNRFLNKYGHGSNNVLDAHYIKDRLINKTKTIVFYQ
jgi:hypothetical protein